MTDMTRPNLALTTTSVRSQLPVRFEHVSVQTRSDRIPFRQAAPYVYAILVLTTEQGPNRICMSDSHGHNFPFERYALGRIQRRFVHTSWNQNIAVRNFWPKLFAMSSHGQWGFSARNLTFAMCRQRRISTIFSFAFHLFSAKEHICRVRALKCICTASFCSSSTQKYKFTNRIRRVPLWTVQCHVVAMQHLSMAPDMPPPEKFCARHECASEGCFTDTFWRVAVQVRFEDVPCRYVLEECHAGTESGAESRISRAHLSSPMW